MSLPKSLITHRVFLISLVVYVIYVCWIYLLIKETVNVRGLFNEEGINKETFINVLSYDC